MESTSVARTQPASDGPSTNLSSSELSLQFSGAIYYLTVPTRERQTPFPYLRQTEKFLRILGETCSARNWVCFAYCLMPDQFRIVVHTKRPNLNEGLGELLCRLNSGMGYGRGVKPAGLFRGRGHLLLVSTRLLPEAIRHALHAPVRAGCVKRLNEWRASSYHATAAGSATPCWLDLQTPWIDGHPTRRHIRDIDGFLGGRTVLSQHLRHGLFLGDAGFVQSVIDRLNQDLPLDDPLLRPMRRSIRDFARDAVDQASAMRAAFQSGDYKLKEIAEYFKVHYTDVSRAING